MHIDSTGKSVAVLTGAAFVAALKSAVEYLAIAAVAAVAGTAVGVGVGEAVKSISSEYEAAAEKEKAGYSEPPKEVYIYRYGFAERGIEKLVPTEHDLERPETGLSFSTRWKPGSATTTIEAINATGILTATQDKPGHIAVTPIGGTLEEWYNQGVGSIWTQTLYSIVWIS